MPFLFLKVNLGLILLLDFWNCRSQKLFQLSLGNSPARFALTNSFTGLINFKLRAGKVIILLLELKTAKKTTFNKLVSNLTAFAFFLQIIFFSSTLQSLLSDNVIFSTFRLCLVRFKPSFLLVLILNQYS